MSAQEETNKAINYAEKWELQTVFEDAFANLLINHPDDPMGFLYDQIVPKAAPPTIDKVLGREILGSRGVPTIEVEVWAKVHGKSEFISLASAPSVDNCAIEDAYVLADTSNPRYGGRGMRQAVSAVTSVYQPSLENKQFFNQRQIDELLINADGTPNKRKSGANTMIATSAAIAVASAKILRLPLFLHLAKHLTDRTQFTVPRPIFAIFNFSSGPISKVYLIPSATVQVEEQIRIIGEIYLHYTTSMKSAVCNDGCFPIEGDKVDDILQTTEIAVSGGGHTLGDDVFLGFSGRGEGTPKFWTDLFDSSSAITYVEDPLPLEETSGLKTLIAKSSENTIIALGKGISSQIGKIQQSIPAKAIVIRPPQAGSLTQAIDVAKAVDSVSKLTVFSTSLNETQDSWIVDAAISCGAHFLQLGPPCRGENITKINRLLEAAKEIEAMQEKESDE